MCRVREKVEHIKQRLKKNKVDQIEKEQKGFLVNKRSKSSIKMEEFVFCLYLAAELLSPNKFTKQISRTHKQSHKHWSS